MKDKIIYTEEELKECPEGMNEGLYKLLKEDLCDSWTCVLCDTVELFKVPITGLQCVCCRVCGMTTMRPTKEFETKEEI